MPNRQRGRCNQLGIGGHSRNEVFLRYMIYINKLWILSHILDETIRLACLTSKAEHQCSGIKFLAGRLSQSCLSAVTFAPHSLTFRWSRLAQD